MTVKNMHLRLLVADFPAMFRFYRDVMGFTPTFGDEKDVYADFDTGSGSLALFVRSFMAQEVGTPSDPAEKGGQDRIALIFGVENVDAACQELREKGVTLVTQPEDHPDWGIRTAHLRDPDGNLIEINTPLH
jgi:lactoylglutathione lyase